MSELPSSIIVGGVRYRVQETGNLGEGERFYFGKVSHTDLLIQVEQHMTQDVQIQAIVHEMFHALLHQTGHIDIQDEERLACLLGCQLPKLLRDNPQLVELMIEGGQDESL